VHDLGTWLIGAGPIDRGCGPLWRRSAFCPATGGWRDFALSGGSLREAARRDFGPERNLRNRSGSARTKGWRL